MSRIVSIILLFIAADLLGCIIGAVAAAIITDAAEVRALAFGRIVHVVSGLILFLSCIPAARTPRNTTA